MYRTAVLLLYSYHSFCRTRKTIQTKNQEGLCAVKKAPPIRVIVRINIRVRIHSRRVRGRGTYLTCEGNHVLPAASEYNRK